MNKLKYLLFLSIIFLAPSVFADTTYDMTSRITSPVEYTICGAGSYTGVELNGATHCWNTNTRNYGTLSRIYFNLPAPTGSTFEPDTAYRLSLYMSTNDWRNRFGTVAVRPGSSYTNNFVDSFTFVSMKQVNITFTVPYGGSTTYQTLWVDLPATNTYTLITGETNWNLSKVTLTKLTSGSSGGSSTPSGPSTSFDDTAIINSGKENTQDIINNNNTNTQDIINNNNSNTQQILDSQNDIQNSLSDCTGNKNNLLSGTTWSNGYIHSGGVGVANTNTLSDYILVSGIKHLTITTNTNFYNIAYAFFNGNKSYISSYDNYQSNKVVINVPSNAVYIRVWFNYNNSTNTINNINDFDVNMYNYYCSSKIDDTTNAINDVNNSINNSNVDNNVGTGFFDDFTSQDFGLSQIITIPLNTIQSLTSKTCVPLQVPIPFTNSNVSLPCMTEIYTTKFPTIYNLWKIVSFGIIAYLIAIDIFHIVKGFKDPESDKVEVLDL